MLEKIHYQRQPWCKESIIKESIFISSREVNDYRRQQPALNYEYPIKCLMIQVMRKYYIIVNLHAHVKTVWCKIWCFYLKETSTTFSCCQHLIKARWHSFVAIPEYSTYDSEDSEDDSDNEVCYPETEVSLLVEKDDIAVIKTSDVHSYYILKLSCQPYIIGQIEKDSYNHTFAGNHKAMGITWKSSKKMFFI